MLGSFTTFLTKADDVYTLNMSLQGTPSIPYSDYFALHVPYVSYAGGPSLQATHKPGPSTINLIQSMEITGQVNEITPLLDRVKIAIDKLPPILPEMAYTPVLINEASVSDAYTTNVLVPVWRFLNTYLKSLFDNIYAETGVRFHVNIRAQPKVEGDSTRCDHHLVLEVKKHQDEVDKDDDPDAFKIVDYVAAKDFRQRLRERVAWNQANPGASSEELEGAPAYPALALAIVEEKPTSSHRRQTQLT
ncbi:hypothetical protein FB45DRAFT_930628 [Roridomyces roridus]|uniref:Uncharacterized protein n=1 Tax=Roridomyces roridus TaxID=1738132 RepID=A0AAD7BFJ3_9AGAR|nr:hypothetical protein FB45DRAFT_930628 [Roridomyces roridus]